MPLTVIISWSRTPDYIVYCSLSYPYLNGSVRAYTLLYIVLDFLIYPPTHTQISWYMLFIFPPFAILLPQDDFIYNIYCEFVLCILQMYLFYNHLSYHIKFYFYFLMSMFHPNCRAEKMKEIWLSPKKKSPYTGTPKNW